MENGRLRAFIAVELPENIKTELAHLIGSLKKTGFSFIKWVNPGSIHLTLKFLGNTPVGMTDNINKVLKSAASGSHNFSLEMGGLGFFPNSRRPRVFWIGIGGNLGTLLKLQEEIDRGTEKLGFPGEKRPFSPHITLARINDNYLPGDLSNFIKEIERLHYDKKLQLSVDFISL